MNDGDRQILVAPEPGAIGPQTRLQRVGIEEAQGAQDPEEAGAFARERHEERDDCHGICPGDGMQKIAEPVAADDQSRGEVGKDDQPEEKVERLREPGPLQERRHDDEADGRNIEYEKGVSELMCGGIIGFVEKAQPALQRRRPWLHH